MRDDKPSTDKAAQESSDVFGVKKVLQGLAGFAPLWKPRYFSNNSNEMVVLPLLFWLIAELKPKHTVQIGLDHGTVFMGLCQAIEKANAGGKLLVYLRDNEVLSLDQAQQCNALYGHIDWLFSKADHPEKPTDHPPQLLILSDPIDERILAGWLPLLAPNAVILLRLPATPEGETQVATLSKCLEQPVQRITFSRKLQNIDILLVGNALPDRIMQLAGNSSEGRVTRALFQRLADSLQQQVLANKQRAALEATNATLNNLKVELKNLRKETDAALQSEAAEVSKAAHLQTRVFDLEQINRQLVEKQAEVVAELEQTREVLRQTKANLADRDECITRHENALANFAMQLEKLTHDEAARETALAQRQSEIFILTDQAESAYREKEHTARELEQTHEALRKAEAELSSLTAQLNKLHQNGETLEEMLAQQKAENDALRSSTSWQITAPIRKVKDGLRRLRLSR